MNAHTVSRRAAGIGAAALTAALAASSCGLQAANSFVPPAEPGSVEVVDSLQGVPVTVGGKNFTEQLILGNIAAILFDVAGAEVTARLNTPGSDAVRQAALSGDIDMNFEYTGTAWVSYLGKKPVDGEQKQWQVVKDADAENGLTWLPPAPMNNTYAFAIRRDKAEELGITKLSELKDLPVEELTFCVEPEFASRDDGFQPMLEEYDLALGDSVPRDNVSTVDTGIVYTNTADGLCNFGEVFTTDGRIISLDLVVLEDDQNFFPLYNVAPVVNSELMEAHPEIADIFAEVTQAMTTELFLELNSRVDNDGEDPGLVARDWLEEEGFVTVG